MNEIARNPGQLPTTQAAEGLPRYRWTLAQFERLTELGVFTERDRIELIDGELIPMASKGVRHERVRGRLATWLSRNLPAGAVSYQEPGWRPGGDRYLEPEMLICSDQFDGYNCPPAEVQLAIEVSDSSLAYDTGLKAATYAELGVREYWVINAKTLETYVHRKPVKTARRYREKVTVAATDELRPQRLALSGLRMSGLGID